MSLNITIGTAPCSWGVWYADGTPCGPKYEVYLKEVSGAGYKTVELGPYGYLPTDHDELKEKLDQYGLSVGGGTACMDFFKARSFDEVKGRIDDICKLVASFNCPYMMTMDGTDGLDKKASGYREQRDKTYKMFQYMGKYCSDNYGITILMHPEKNSLIETKQDLKELMDLGLYICFDNGHYTLAEGSWQFGDTAATDFMREFHDRIPYLHFKNIDSALRKKQMEGCILEKEQGGLMCELDKGLIDYKAYKEVLNQLNYSGVAIIEQDIPKDAFNMAKRNLAFLKEIGMID